VDIACAMLNGMKMDDKTLNVCRATARLALAHLYVKETNLHARNSYPYLHTKKTLLTS
jgi:hypothetical protein